MINRYVCPPMAQLWSEEEKFNSWLQVEIAACKAWQQEGKIPEDVVQRIEEKAAFTVSEIDNYEKEVRHDVIAFIQCVSQYIGDDARYFHFGLTSSDVVDTAQALRMKKGLKLIIESAEKVRDILKNKAIKYKNTIMIGRTHGIHAEPTTFGLKLLLFYEELKRNIHRLRGARKIIAVGKLSGAVGTLSHLPPAVEKHTMQALGLEIEPVSSQVVQRDRHAEVIMALALVAAGIEKIATEIRNLQRTDIGEVQEPFMAGQKGSSAMPHKKNPVTCEQLSGLSRLVRSHVVPALENIPLWHERDISHSSVERVIIPDAFCLVHYMLEKMQFVLENLVMYPENMKKNLEKTAGLVFSQKIMIYLIDKGLSRREAYEIVQRNALKSWREGNALQENLLQDREFKKQCSAEKLAEIMSYSSYLGNVEAIFQRTLDDVSV